MVVAKKIAWIPGLYKQDFLSSIVVFLVALPLCLGIAVACNLPPATGLISGIIGGILVGTLSGAPLQVSGPAAGLVSILCEIINTHGIEALGLIVVMAGLGQIALGYFRLSNTFRAVSPAVIQGMLSGIGVAIMASQCLVMVGYKPSGKTIENIMALPQALFKSVFPSLEHLEQNVSAIIGILTIIVIILWSWLPKKWQTIPGALVAILLSVTLSSYYNLPIEYISLPESIWNTVKLPSPDVFKLLLDDQIWIAAATVAFVATAETILSTTALERLQHGQPARYDQEILAQGVGNTVAGIVGALPVTGVIVRSSANIEAGAKTRVSTMLHGLWIIVTILLFPQFIEMIPISSLAAILVYSGCKLIHLDHIQTLSKIGKEKVLIFFITVIGVVFTNLLEGVIIGFILSSLTLLHKLSKLETETRANVIDRHIEFYVRGSATFISLPKLLADLDTLPLGWTVNVHIELLTYIDHACLEALINFENHYKSQGGDFIIEWQELARKMQTEIEPSRIVDVLKNND